MCLTTEGSGFDQKSLMIRDMHGQIASLQHGTDDRTIPLQWLLDRDGRMGWDADFGEIDLWSHCVVTGPGSRPDGAAPSASSHKAWIA